MAFGTAACLVPNFPNGYSGLATGSVHRFNHYDTLFANSLIELRQTKVRIPIFWFLGTID